MEKSKVTKASILAKKAQALNDEFEAYKRERGTAKTSDGKKFEFLTESEVAKEFVEKRDRSFSSDDGMSA